MTVPPAIPRSVLVVCLRYLGDTLLLRPVFSALRNSFPEARLDALVTAGTACALDDLEAASGVMEWPRGAIWREAGLLGRLAARRYDWVVDLTGNDRSALVALLSGAPLRAAYDRPNLSAWSLRRCAYSLRLPPKKKKEKPHVLLQRLQLLEACGVPAGEIAFHLVPRADALAWADQATEDLPQPRFHAHITSRDMQKAIPVAVAREVFRGMMQKGGLVVTAGPAAVERDHLARCLKGLPTDRVRVFSEVSWHQLVALISQADRYWGADTAPAHVAAALGKTMLIHYGPSNAVHWKPLHIEGMADVRECACSREKKKTCPSGVPGACLTGIDPAEVLSALSALGGRSSV